MKEIKIKEKVWKLKKKRKEILTLKGGTSPFFKQFLKITNQLN